MKDSYNKLYSLIREENEAFEINVISKIKTGNQYYFSKNAFNWSKEFKINEFLKLKCINSSFTDHTEIIKNEILTRLLDETRFIKQESNISFKLTLINRDSLFQKIFGRILTNQILNETDRCVITELMASKLLDFKIDENYKLVSISIVEHSKYWGLKSNYDVINDRTSSSSFSSPIANVLNLKPKSWGTCKYDTRIQIKQALTIDESSYKKFELLQKAIAEIIRFPNRRSKQLFLRCKRNQYQYMREKEITSYKYNHTSDNLKNFDISFNIVHYTEYNLNKNDRSFSELCLRPNSKSFIQLSITSFLTDIINKEDSERIFNEIFDNSWDLGQWLAQTASLCV